MLKLLRSITQLEVAILATVVIVNLLVLYATGSLRWWNFITLPALALLGWVFGRSLQT